MSTANTCTDKHVQHVRTIKRVIIVNVVCCACMTTTIVHVCVSLHVFACFNCTLGIACLLVYTGICMRAYPTWKSQFITSTGKVFSKVSFTVSWQNHLRGILVVSYWKRD